MQALTCRDLELQALSMKQAMNSPKECYGACKDLLSYIFSDVSKKIWPNGLRSVQEFKEGDGMLLIAQLCSKYLPSSAF